MDLIVVGTNRPGNNSSKLALYYQKELLRRGQEWDILYLSDLPHEVIVTDLYNQRSVQFAPMQEKVFQAERFIFIVPEYNGSYPGVLKVFIDACTFPFSFANKKAALVGVSTGKYGNIRGIDHFTGVCHYVRMHVMPLKVHISQIHRELDEYSLIDPLTVKYVAEQLDAIVQF